MIRKKSIQQIALERFKGMHASFSTSVGGSRVQEEEVVGKVKGGEVDEDLLFKMSELDAR
jgi:hypothetical protein